MKMIALIEKVLPNKLVTIFPFDEHRLLYLHIYAI